MSSLVLKLYVVVFLITINIIDQYNIKKLNVINYQDDQYDIV
jgi:hypothetical protein